MQYMLDHRQYALLQPNVVKFDKLSSKVVPTQFVSVNRIDFSKFHAQQLTA